MMTTEEMYIFGRDDPDFIRQIVSAIYCPLFREVWLSSVC